MLSFKNFFAHPLTTLGGALLGVLQASAIAAAHVFTATGNVTDPKPYMVAAGVGAATAVVGGLLPSSIPAPAAVPLTAADLSGPAYAPAPVVVTAAEPVVPSVPSEVTAAVEQLVMQIIAQKATPPAQDVTSAVPTVPTMSGV